MNYIKMLGINTKNYSSSCKDGAFNIFIYILVAIAIISGIPLLWELRDAFDWSQTETGKYRNEKFSLDLRRISRTLIKVDDDEGFPRDPNCTFWDCVNIYRCGQNGFDRLTVFIYPLQDFVANNDKKHISAAPLTQEYFQILDAVYKSPYYTSNPNEACLFLPSIDLLNQELITIHLVNRALASLKYWEKGENHLIFNLLPGKFPDFNRTIDINTDRAILLGGGFDSWAFRAGFDISLPVWSPSLQHLHKLEIISAFQRKYLLIVGQVNVLPPQLRVLQSHSEDFPNDVLLLQNCSHSESDEHEVICKEYKRNIVHNYPKVLLSGTFCLIARSVRLGQPDFLEILAYNCVPIIAIDNYILPFSEVIDWSLATLRIREKDLHSLMQRIRDISPTRILEMQQQGRWLFNRYFKDLRAITLTTLDILDGRIFPHRARNLRYWNTADSNYKIPLNPLFLPIIAPKSQGFTAVILTYDRVQSLFTLIQKLSLVPSLQSILVIWNNRKPAPHISSFPMVSKPIKVLQTPSNKLSNRFFPYAEIETEAILTIDDDIIMLTADELDFGFEVWREFPDRIVGFPSRIHVWDNITMRWHYESEWTNQISMVLTGAAFHHKFWNHMYTYAMPGDIKNWVDDHMNCEDIAMNFLVANITNKPPIKVTPRKKFKCPEYNHNEMLSADLNHMRERSACINRFAQIYGHMPLRSVEFRADPVLFKDNFPEKLKRFNDVGAL